MPKRSTSDFLEKVSRIIRVPPVFTPKSMKKLVFLNLNINLILNSSRSNFKRLKHYNYGFVQEYQFSPCNTPLIGYSTTNDRIRKKKVKKTANWKRSRDLCSMLYVFTCLGVGTEDGGGGGFEFCNSPYLEVLGSSSTLRLEETMLMKEEEQKKGVLDYGDEEEADEDDDGYSSVDEKAEKFIEKFYHQIRMQRRQQELSLS